MHTKVLLSGGIRAVNNAGPRQNSLVRVTKSYPNHSSLRLIT